ncbi:hypothetical protein V2J09_021738 [Rumex salicifolius]
MLVRVEKGLKGMASKKVIAICQSGGEFVTNKDGSLIYNGGDAYAVDIDETTKLSDFRKEVAEMFECNSATMTIKYLLPGNKRTLITVSKDKDLNRMVTFLGETNSVDVYVIPEEAPVQNVSNMLCSRSSRTTASEPVIASAAAAADDPIDMNIVTDDCIETLPVDTTPLRSYPMGQPLLEGGDDAISVGQRFASFDEFRDALRKYSLAHCFSYKYKKNDNNRVTARCKTEGCNWRVYVSRLATTRLVYVRRVLGVHTCEGSVSKTGYRGSRGWIGNIIKEKLKAFPNYKPKDIADEIKNEYGIELNYSQAWRAKELAREQLQGSFKEAYTQLPFYCRRIIETNPGSVATFNTKEDSSFHRLFISFHASLSGFRQGCRPLLFLDSTPLKSKYQGELIAALAPDGDDGVFPVAFAVVDMETEDNWLWFLQELKAALSMPQPITFVADFQNGLKESLAVVFSNGYHSYCLRYLTEKLNEDLKVQLSHEARRLMINDLYSAACATRLEDFQRCVENIKAISVEAYNWVIRSEPRQWANAFFEGARYNLMTSDFGQMFFNWVSEVSDLPMNQMIDVLRGKMMELMYQRRVQSNQWTGQLTPSKEDQLRKEILKAQSLTVPASHGNIFNVIDGQSCFPVDMDNWICSCKGWQLNGLPCCHAVTVIEYIDRDPYDFCSRNFTIDSYRLTYTESIYPVPNVERLCAPSAEQSAVTVTPPSNKRPPGRPKQKHVESVELSKRQFQCSKCKGLGHNKKSCKS